MSIAIQSIDQTCAVSFRNTVNSGMAALTNLDKIIGNIISSITINVMNICISMFVTKNTAMCSWVGSEKANARSFGVSSKFINILYMTIIRTKFCRGMFQSAFQNIKVALTTLTCSLYSRFFHIFIRAFFRAKYLYIIFYSPLRYFKRCIANRTHQIHSFLSKGMLTFGRTKKIFMSLDFIRIGLENIATEMTFNKHRNILSQKQNLNNQEFKEKQ